MGRYAIRRDPIIRVPLLIIAATQERSYVEVDDREVHVVFGLANERIPVAAIRSVAPGEWPWYLGGGVRIGGGGIAYVGSTRGIVRLELAEKLPFRVFFKLTARFGVCTLSLEEPEAFIDDVRAKLARA
ncbi:MAG: hypothetical protein IT373_22355 [Polyangiaceae bacterium]|nr:hypothetical protein [Polyangiaceae bacterium]